MKYPRLISYFFLLLLLACNNEPKTGPVKINFDRDSCERCRMLISDRFHAVQIRGGDDLKVYKFDDIGDAVIWLDQQPWKEAGSTEVWVTHHQTGEWINAKQAWYVREKHTPMNYGFSAESQQSPNAVKYLTMAITVLDKEEKQRSQ